MNYSPLLNEYKLNSKLTLKNRILMAPMTRVKATADFIPTRAMADYYAKRADAGLIVTEGTVIHQHARGHDNVPGIFEEQQIKAWQRVTDQVHQKNGLIFLQIWHVGRVSHSHFLQGNLPISASETTMTNKVSRSVGLTYGKSRAATLFEIQEIIEHYAKAANNAIKAGFDGVEIHGANGYLIDQFLHYHTNQRADDYGGTPQNMARFALEVVQACGEMIGYERVGLRLSPGAYLNEILGDDRDKLVFEYLLDQLNRLPIAYLHTGNFNDTQTFKELNDLTMTDFMRKHYRAHLVACGGYTVESALRGIQKKSFDLVAMGRPFIANPNFIHQILFDLPLLPYHVDMLNSLD